MSRQRRSAIVDLLTKMNKPLSTRSIAAHLRIDSDLARVRVRQLEDHGRIRRVGNAARIRDVRWSPCNTTVGVIEKVAMSYRGAENLEMMRAAFVERMRLGLPADWVCEPLEEAA